MKKVLITGAGGFIGSHLSEMLVAKGLKVKAFVHYNSFNRWGWIDSFDKDTINSIEVLAGDIRDPFGVRKAMEGCDAVFHLAALIGIPYSYQAPQSYIETNVTGTLNILHAARELGVEKVIHTSTSEVYGTAQFVPISENHPMVPQSPYAATKASADLLALSFYHSFSLPVTVVRPFNTYGPRQSARAVIPTIITQILSGKEKIYLGSLTPTRDLTFIKDTVQGFIKAAESEEAIGRVINLGNNAEISIKDLAILLAKLVKRSVSIVTDTQRIRPKRSEVERLRADITQAHDLLGWIPQYSLETGLNKTIEWFKSNAKVYKPEIYNV